MVKYACGVYCRLLLTRIWTAVKTAENTGGQVDHEILCRCWQFNRSCPASFDFNWLARFFFCCHDDKVVVAAHPGGTHLYMFQAVDPPLRPPTPPLWGWGGWWGGGVVGWLGGWGVVRSWFRLGGLV